MKGKVLNICRDQLKAAILNLKFEMDDAQKAANEYGLPRDRYDAFRTQLLRKKDMFAQQLAKANKQLDILSQIDPEKSCSQVELGALVLTNKQKMFISVGLGKLKVDDDVIYAISPAVPIYKAMGGKKVGEEFIFNDIRYKIEKIS